MDDKEIAKRILDAAGKKGGNVMVGDLAWEDIEHARARGWLVPVGIGHFQLTHEGREAASG